MNIKFKYRFVKSIKLYKIFNFINKLKKSVKINLRKEYYSLKIKLDF